MSQKALLKSLDFVGTEEFKPKFVYFRVLLKFILISELPERTLSYLFTLSAF